MCIDIDKCLEFDPVTIAPDRLLKDAIALFGQKHIDYILVVKAELIGILTKGDVLRAISTEIDLETTSIDTMMTQPVILCS